MKISMRDRSHAHLWVEGDGPQPARYAVVGEAPSVEEVEAKRSFVGPSGEILWTYFRKTLDIKRSECYVTNWRKTLWDKKLEPENKVDPEEAAAWTEMLEGELQEVNPEMIFTVGAFAARALLGDDFRMDEHGGRAWYDPLGRKVVPLIHPAAALHGDTKSLANLWHGMKWQDRFGAAVFPFGGTEFSYVELDPVVLVYERCEYLFDTGQRWVAVDTEGYRDRPYSVQVGVPGMAGFALYPDDTPRLFDALRAVRPLLVFHNAPWDIRILHAMGFDVLKEGFDFVDPMEYAYLLQTEPRGLKAQALRWCGLRMRKYEDVVLPFAERRRRDWMGEVRDLIPVEKEPMLTRKGKQRTSKGKPLFAYTYRSVVEESLHKKLSRACKSYDEGKTINVGQRWRGWKEEEKIHAIELQIDKRGMDNIGVDFPDMSPWSAHAYENGKVLFRDYACKDPVATALVLPYLREATKEWREIIDIDLKAQRSFIRMTQVGMTYDEARGAELLRLLESDMASFEEHLREVAGVPDLNLNATGQIADVLRGMGIDTGQRTEGGRMSVGADLLQPFRKTHPWVDLYLEWKERATLCSNFLLPLPNYIEEDGRLHPKWKLYTVVSGRPAAEDPNILAFPSRTELGRRVRGCFVAGEGRVFGSWDMSQLELRLAAALSGDENMSRAFREGRDIHQNTGDELELGRTVAKTANFEMLYGGTAYKMTEILASKGIVKTFEECEDIIKRWFELYPGMRQFIDDAEMELRAQGYVTTLFGRPRWLPGIFLRETRYPGMKLVPEARRQGGNLKIQGTGQELLRRAQARLDEDVLPVLRSAGYAEPVLQYHDELVLEIDEHLKELADDLMVEVMEADKDLFPNVPLVCDRGAFGKSWGDLKG